MEMHPNTQEAQSVFTRYDISPEDTITGQALSPLQEQVIQNLISSYAEDKVNLTYDVVNPHAFIQKEAELQGQILVLQYILELSRAAHQALKQQALNPNL